MGDDGKSAVQPHRSRSWVRWLFIGLGVILLVLVAFHGPILRAVLHTVAVKIAAGQNLKLDFRIEGDPLDQITLRNVRATATGRSALQSLDAREVKVDYSLSDLVFHGMSEVLKNVELHEVTAVLDPSKAPLATPTPPPDPNKKISLPAYFPDRLDVTDANVTVRGQPKDTVVRNFNLGLYPDKEGALRIDKLQIPNVHDWTDITATTTYANKNLFLKNLTFDQGHHFQTVNIDVSKARGGKLELQVSGAVGEGKIEGNVGLSTTKSSFKTKTKVNASDISLGQLSEYFGQPAGALAGHVKNFKMDWQGALDSPETWAGTIAAEVDNVQQGGIKLDHVGLDVVADKGTATVREARIDRGTNHVSLKGTVQLPKTTEGFRRTPGDLKLTVDAPNLQELTAFMNPPMTGSLQATGTIKTDQSIARLNLDAKGDLIGYDKAAVNSLTAKISATKKLPATDATEEPYYANLSSSIEAQLNAVRYDQYVIDSVSAQIKSDGAKVSLEPVALQRKENSLVVRGNYQLPPPNGKALEQPADLHFTLRVPQLADFWRDEAPGKVRGELQADGRVQIRKSVTSGQLNLSGHEIQAQKMVVKELSAQVAIAQNIVYLNDLTATLNEKDYLNAHGTVELQKPFKYAGEVTANLADLSTFEPLLATEEKTTKLAGSLVVNWNGRGEASTFKNNGELNLKLENGRYADLQNLKANIEAHYTPEELFVPIVFLGSDKLSFTSSLTAKGSTLEVSKIQIDQGEAKYATAYASIPFVWSHVGSEKPLFPDNGKVNISFQSENLDLAKLFRDLGQEPPVAGKLSVKLDAQGPLDQLQASLDLQLQNVKANAAEQLKPTDVNLALRLQNNQLKVDGKIQQPLLQPISLTAQLPLNVSELIEKKKLDEQTAVDAKIVMPRSSLNFVREFVPALRQLDGSMALNVNVDGTIGDPALSGAADMNILLARFENATLPALTNFKAQLNFRENTLRFDRFGGDLAGGPFTLSGSISFAKLTEPSFDLRLKANSVLVARNDNLTARVDADIKIAGPLNSASVSGQVLTTNSRFLKNIDIIPISLPGRPAPLPEPPSAAPALSFPNPPLRDWKFDIVIKSKEPFLIRGNLAAGSANIDMKMAGTGLHPQLQGQVRLENFEATLPFSTLTINLGFLYFDPDDPLNPRIEMQGTSLIQDYTIHVYIYGTALHPEASFSSEPPLPQEDIISLLATGVTRENLSSGNVLASRGLMLLGKELYRKIFKKNDDEKPKTDSIFNRLSVEYSGADPRTGEQTATAKYKVSDNVVLIGDIGVAGGFRGIVKYVIRFR
ncbi:MAG: translocation/assembly module TamB domain-containing protein [Chthoniobacterales bacterium]|nr:translocation/assembly module TamB domain-containing protein [Chthoniobacterales bacterium]